MNLYSVRLASAFSFGVALLSVSCADKAKNCDFVGTCPPDTTDGGNGGSGGGTSPACPAGCSGSTPLCDTAGKKCVECLASTDCKDASASTCINGSCEACSTNADCAHISSKNVCKTTGTGDAGADAGTCVQCTGSQYSSCGQSAGKNLVCSGLTDNCSTYTEDSAGLCQSCVSDAQCAPGQLCAEQVFNNKSVGYFCFYKQGDTANGAPADCFANGRPYAKVLNTTSIDGTTADLCTLRATTCPAQNEFSSKDCAPTGSADNGLCGFAPGVDSKCAAASSTQYRCTVTCLSDEDCLSGVTCNTTTNPRFCSFQ